MSYIHPSSGEFNLTNMDLDHIKMLIPPKSIGFNLTNMDLDM